MQWIAANGDTQSPAFKSLDKSNFLGISIVFTLTQFFVKPSKISALSKKAEALGVPGSCGSCKPNQTQVSQMSKFTFVITSSQISGEIKIHQGKNSLHPERGNCERVKSMKFKIWKAFVQRLLLRKASGGIQFAYRPPNNNNLKLFFEETAQSENQHL